MLYSMLFVSSSPVLQLDDLPKNSATVLDDPFKATLDLVGAAPSGRLAGLRGGATDMRLVCFGRK